MAQTVLGANSGPPPSAARCGPCSKMNKAPSQVSPEVAMPLHPKQWEWKLTLKLTIHGPDSVSLKYIFFTLNQKEM